MNETPALIISATKPDHQGAEVIRIKVVGVRAEVLAGTHFRADPVSRFAAAGRAA